MDSNQFYQYSRTPILHFITTATKNTNLVMPDLIRHPAFFWIPAFAGMTIVGMFNCHINKILKFKKQSKKPDFLI